MASKVIEGLIMPRVTKSVTAKAKHKKVLNLLKVIMEPEVDCIKLQNNQTLNLCNMHLEIEKIKKRFRSLWISRINAASENLEFLIQSLIKWSEEKKYYS